MGCAANAASRVMARRRPADRMRIMGMPGKPDGIDGGQVEKYFKEGRVKVIAEYCESDVVNTYRVWLRYELFRGQLTETTHRASELSLMEFIKRHEITKQHLRDVLVGSSCGSMAHGSLGPRLPLDRGALADVERGPSGLLPSPAITSYRFHS
jgi:Predicted 3'-5' exonuclease related to the exonuclease domain of PolB